MRELLPKALLQISFVVLVFFLRAATPVTRRWRAPGSVFPASPAYFAHRQQLVLPATLQKISEFFLTATPDVPFR